MAREFDDGSSQYLLSGVQSIIVDNTDLPITMACWFKSDDAAAYQVLLAIVDYSSNEYLLLAAAGSVVGDPIRVTAYDGVTTASAVSSTGYSAGTWHHACGIFSAANSRAAFIDGGSKGTNATNVAGVGPLDRFVIGARVYAGGGTKDLFMSGAIAEAAIWKAALSDAEVAILAHGFSPLMMRPESLVTYWALIRDADIDRVGGYHLTANGGPTVSAHMPKLLYPSAKLGYFITVPPTPSIPPAHAPPAVDSAVMIV